VIIYARSSSQRLDLEDSMAESILEKIKALYPEKFAPEEEVFSTIHRGDRIFIGTACGSRST